MSAWGLRSYCHVGLFVHLFIQISNIKRYSIQSSADKYLCNQKQPSGRPCSKTPYPCIVLGQWPSLLPWQPTRPHSSLLLTVPAARLSQSRSRKHILPTPVSSADHVKATHMHCWCWEWGVLWQIRVWGVVCKCKMKMEYKIVQVLNHLSYLDTNCVLLTIMIMYTWALYKLFCDGIRYWQKMCNLLGGRGK